MSFQANVLVYAYVQLSNIYASAGNWEESTEMRRKMKERNLVKGGWIEVGDNVHKFYVEKEDDEAKKEILLNQHSEKIAVTFGLISTLKSRPVRVFKNFRVCGDCHNTVKYMLMVSGREIVLRDIN